MNALSKEEAKELKKKVRDFAGLGVSRNAPSRVIRRSSSLNGVIVRLLCVIAAAVRATMWGSSPHLFHSVNFLL
jgi:ABC-type polysaccharide/polyol phosphate transport system ATPase subunit